MARPRLTCLETSNAKRAPRSSAWVKSTLVASVVLGALVVVPAPAAAQWQPDRFQIFCGTPFPFSLTSQWRNFAREFGWDTRHAKHYLNYVESLGTELDDPAPGCIDDDRLAEMADMAGHALLQIKGVGSAQGRQFTDPSPERLGPVVLDENGERVARIYADPGYEGIGSTHVRPGSGGHGVEPWSVAHVRFGVDHLATQPAWSRYRTIAHELVHVVQSAQQYRTDERAEDKASFWIGEGTADALAAEFTERRGYGVRPPLSVRGSRSLYGLRPYHRNLTWVSGADDRDEHGNVLITDYTSSSFFRYLADRFYDGSFHYLIDWFAVPDRHEGRDDWLEWTDDLLRWDAGGVDHPLYLVFPDFIAHYAGWGERKYPHIGEETWMREAFGGCHTVTLSPSEMVARLSLELEPLSAVCVKVLVGGVNPDEAVSVQWMAYDQDTDRLDNLHLTAARVSNTVGGGTFDCYEEAEKGGPNSLCLHKPFVGARGGRELSPSDGAGVTSTGNGYAKAWLGIEQIPSGADPIENVYFLVHTPVRPRDATHDDANNPESQSVQVDIGLERHKITVATGPTTASAAVNGAAGLGLVPMRGGGGGGSSPDDPTGVMGSITSVMDMATDPEAMSEGLFLQNMPMGTVLPTMDGPCDGICMVMVDQKEVRPDGYGGFELATVSAIGLGLEEPVPFGATGTFKAMVTGCDEEECDGGLAMGEGQITVMRYDDQALHLTASGEYCVIRGLASLTCSDRRTFEAEVLKPFGWAYDGGRTFTSIDTPGMAEYREYTTKALAEVMPGVVTVWRTAQDPRPGEDAPAPGEDGQGEGESGGGVVAAACDCTCEGYDALMGAVAEYQAALKAANDEGRMPPPTPPAMRNLMRCTMECARQWSACGQPPSS